MYLINELYSELFSSYRRCWGFFHHDKDSYTYKVFRVEKEIKESFENCENHLERVWSLSVKSATNSTVFYDLKSAIRELINVKLKISSVLTINAMENIRLCHLLNSLQVIENELNNYKINCAVGLDNTKPIVLLKIAN
jgi:hypothetical protein